MTGFADLIDDQSATEGGRLYNVNLDGTEGTLWRWRFTNVKDHAGNLVDLTGLTCVCKLLDDIDDPSPVLTLTATGGNGEFTVSATAAQTTGLAAGATRNKPRKVLWYLRITGASSQVLQVWGPSGSTFRIYPE